VKRTQKRQSERDIETYLCDEVESMGGHAYKFTSPGRRNVPDRLCVLPGLVFFVECKAPGESPTKAQERELNRLAELDQWVFVVDSKTGVRKALNKIRGVMCDD